MLRETNGINDTLIAILSRDKQKREKSRSVWHSSCTRYQPWKFPCTPRLTQGRIQRLYLIDGHNNYTENYHQPLMTLHKGPVKHATGSNTWIRTLNLTETNTPVFGYTISALTLKSQRICGRKTWKKKVIVKKKRKKCVWDIFKSPTVSWPSMNCIFRLCSAMFP